MDLKVEIRRLEELRDNGSLYGQQFYSEEAVKLVPRLISRIYDLEDQVERLKRERGHV